MDYSRSTRGPTQTPLEIRASNCVRSAAPHRTRRSAISAGRTVRQRRSTRLAFRCGVPRSMVGACNYETHYVSREVASPVHATHTPIRHAPVGNGVGGCRVETISGTSRRPSQDSSRRCRVGTSTKPIRILLQRPFTTRACDSSRIRKAPSTQSCTYFVTITVGGSCLWQAATSQKTRRSR